MGEMADMFLDEVLEHEEQVLAYLHGRFDDLEAYERGIIDELGRLPGDGRCRNKKGRDNDNRTRRSEFYCCCHF